MESDLPPSAITATERDEGRRETLRNLASHQRWLITSIGIYLFLLLAFNITRGVPLLIMQYLAWACLALQVTIAVFMFFLAKRVYHTGTGVLFLILGLVPCIGLFFALFLNSKANAVLQQNDIETGWFGIDPSAI